MAQLLITLIFAAVLIAAARLMLHELTRPLTLHPACADDLLYDALCAAEARMPTAAAAPLATPRGRSAPIRRSPGARSPRPLAAAA